MAMRAMGSACVECDEIITNPLCPQCLVQEMVVQIGEQDSCLAHTIYGFDISGDTTCISCHKPMGICVYCCSKDVYEYLREKNQLLAKEFLSRFDFELRKEINHW